MNRKRFTIKDHLRGREAVIIALYECFVQLVEACGPFDYVVGKDRIAFRCERRNFAVAKPKTRSLDSVLVLQRRLQDRWIREAYQAGQGQHLAN